MNVRRWSLKVVGALLLSLGVAVKAKKLMLRFLHPWFSVADTAIERRPAIRDGRG